MKYIIIAKIFLFAPLAEPKILVYEAPQFTVESREDCEKAAGALWKMFNFDRAKLHDDSVKFGTEVTCKPVE